MKKSTAPRIFYSLIAGRNPVKKSDNKWY